MEISLKRVVSIGTLLVSLIALVLLLKKPAPVGRPQAPALIAQNAKSFDQKLDDFEQATSTPAGAVDSDLASSKAEVRINSDEVSAVLAQSFGNSGTAGTPTSDEGAAAPVIKDQQVSFEGDLVHGQFLTQIAGKDVWITISGHLGERDGYATFDPTEFKVGDLNVPVSLVNPALQKKLSEERDRLKLPDNVGNLKVENSQLVMQQK
ncbi:MAG TPA: hypothetical protein VMP68_20315 [Candidatus Eisenbacteria bacterium]|nr:hypothetical protein [Candidatus Eisenbacteria bacterium]